MKFTILWLFFLTITSGDECPGGLLILGGENQFGAFDTIHLLTSAGWCDKVNLPQLPEPISNPAVYVKNLKVVICGFTVIPCRYAEAGFMEWLPFHWIFHNGEVNEIGPDETNFKMVGAFNEVLMTSTSRDSYSDGRTYRNPMQMQGNLPNKTITSWYEFYGSPFRLGDRKMGGSCLVAKDDYEVLLTGGYGKRVDCGYKCSSVESDPLVGRWSINGNAAGNGPPDWETGVVDDMLIARENHSCMGYMGGVLVSGGAFFQIFYHPVGPTERTTLLQSTEFWNGYVWKQVGDLLEPRMDFKMLEFCGNVVAVGGRQVDGHQTFFLDTIEILEENELGLHWAPVDTKLPYPLANFGMAGVMDSNVFCETGPFH